MKLIYNETNLETYHIYGLLIEYKDKPQIFSSSGYSLIEELESRELPKPSLHVNILNWNERFLLAGIIFHSGIGYTTQERCFREYPNNLDLNWFKDYIEDLFQYPNYLESETRAKRYRFGFLEYIVKNGFDAQGQKFLFKREDELKEFLKKVIFD